MRRPKLAIGAAIVALGLPALVVSAQQMSRMPGTTADSNTPPASSSVDPMLAARGARTLLRNGSDYLAYKEYARALRFFRAAESRQLELDADEVKSLRQGIQQAQRGLREAAPAGSLSDRSRTRRPGALATARPAPEATAPANDGIQLAAATQAPADPEPRPQMSSRSAEPSARRASMDAPVELPEPSGRLPEPGPAPVVAEPVPPTRTAAVEPPPMGNDAPAPLPEPRPDSRPVALPEPAPSNPTPATAPESLPASSAPATQPELPPIAVAPPEPPATAAPAPAVPASKPDLPAAIPSPRPIEPPSLPELPGPDAPAPTPAPPSQPPTPAPASTSPVIGLDPLPGPSTTPAAPSEPGGLPELPSPGAPAPTTPDATPASAPEPVQAPARPPAASPVPATSVNPTPTAGDLPPLPPLPGNEPSPTPVPAAEATPPAADVPATPRPIAEPVPAPAADENPSRPVAPRPTADAPDRAPQNPPRSQADEDEIARIAQRQVDDARGRQLPGNLPQPLPIIPRNPTDMSTPDDVGSSSNSSTRFELTRAPSPTEVIPIRRIPLPEENVPLPPRNFDPSRKYWQAPALCHMPLYFQDASLERYGHSVEQFFGPTGRYLTYPLDSPRWSTQRFQILQPAFSAGLFAGQILALPYNLIVDPPWEAEYDLGYYRPGDKIPTDLYYLPTTGVGPPLRGKNY